MTTIHTLKAYDKRKHMIISIDAGNKIDQIKT